MEPMLDIKELINAEGIIDAGIIAAQKSFWEYCKLINPKFYRDDRQYLHDLCDTLQGIFEGTLINARGEPYKNLMINLPPRHGKSYTMNLFYQWCFGRNNETRAISVSYNEILSGRFARNVRDGIDAERIGGGKMIFHDVFPTTRIKYGDASYSLWSLEGQYFSFLATGFGGTMTGLGCSIGTIDDPIKSDKEAFNETALDEQWAWYTDTFLSRLEEGAIQIIIMTRWSTKDLCGRLLDSDEAGEWYVFSRAACLDEKAGTMLCPSVLSYKTYARRRRRTSTAIADANYQQMPVDIKGKLYTSFATYDDLPRDDNGLPKFERIISYTDTADTGSDDLCSGVAGEFDGELYMLDVYMTDEPMEITEPKTAEQLYAYGVTDAMIESNNGGRGFARAVERHLWEDYGTRSIPITWFHQGENKHARIMSNSTYVMQHIKMPADWESRWPRYYASMVTYQRSATKNKHDDGPDMTTGLAEKVQNDDGKGRMSILWI